ncbi:putative uncharacterized protein DDB_G0285119 isoform X2 [Tribolium madens]|uniref:putative uncharacterized protein DDB_G0285119 isoform X2 n=1 Tax=Tribolium madens TaxID=41895 RepID=UPI001CF74A3A|nr:putative uncharacterized protein DDB_G0285119 isoform X2 [Tribolium madens]
MSDMGDDDLLGGDSDCEPYDFSEEKEELLLQGDDDYSKAENSYKKGSISDTDDQEDVLSLDIEEDFQDVEEKLLHEENEESKIKKNEKFSSERKQQNTQNIPVVKKHPHPQKSNNALPKERNAPKVITRNENRRRNVGRGNFHSRPNFVKNNFQRRRNGTVLINPRYEGTVRANENTRLAWDNTHYSQSNASNFVQPWVSGNGLNYEANPQNQLLNNLVALLPQTSSNVFQSSANSYQPTLSFEPPPGIQTSSYNQVQPYCQWNSPNVLNDNQVSRGLYPATQSSTSSLQPCLSRGTQSFNDSYTNYYNSKSNQSYSSQNVRPNYENRRKPYNNTLSSQTTNFQNKNSNYISNSFYNRNSNLSNVPNRPSHSSSNIVQIESRNQLSENRPTTYRNDFKQGQNQNFVSNMQQFQIRTENEPIISAVKRYNQHFDEQKNRRANDNSGTRSEQPEKKTKLDEVSQKSIDSTKESKGKSVPPNENTDFEDEETRLYRMKIEEQKRERERILQMKEERRRQMMLQRKQEEDKKLPPPPQHTEKPKQENFSKPVSFQKPNFERVADIVTVQNQYAQKSITKPNQVQNSVQYSNVKSDISDGFPNLTFKITNKIQENAPVQNMPKSEVSSSGFMSNRVVVVKGKTGSVLPVSSTSAPKPVSNEGSQSSNVGQGLSSFFNNRKVLKKDSTLLDTRLVVVNNLSANFNQNKLMALTRGIGEIQKLRVDTQERQATILFKSVASAHAFFKKYQRRILDDLSVIEVKLEPMI